MSSLVSFTPRKSIVIVAAIVATFLISLTAVHAQGVGSTRGLPGGEGRHIIKGRVFTPAGRPVEAGMKIRLEGQGDSAGSSATATDVDGAFNFRNLPPGSYTVVVEGATDFDPARESVSIQPGFGAYAAAQTINVAINLKARGAAAAFAKLPKEARDSYTKGMEAAAKGDNQKAVDFMDKAVVAYPEFPEALAELGLGYMRLNKMEKAAQTYETLLKFKPDNVVAHQNAGIAYYNLATVALTDKKADEAKQLLTRSEAHLRESLRMNKTSPTSHYYLGLILIKSRSYAEAQAEMEAAIANGGDSLALAHKYLGGLYISAKRNKDAADQLEKYLELDPKAKDAEQIRSTIKQLRAQQ
ncbi:MAG: tetratricopeptide repeat protein [Pyrinomonadaceae bacterium]